MASLSHAALRASMSENARVARPYANPYLAGIGLGLVLLAAFVLAGRGLGASGAVHSGVAWLVSLAAPGYARSNEFLAPYLEGGTHPLKDWLVFEVVGVFVGALLSALLAGRAALAVEKGPRLCVTARLGFAFAGGALMNLGSWAFMLCVFGGAYAVALPLRRLWR